jgi:uroporphyrinogen-III decarboxylase
MDEPERYMALADVFWEAQKPGIEAAVRGGTDLIYASGVAAELMSPQMFEATFLPLLKRQSEFVHKLGCKFYYHSCGKTKLFIEKGFYNEILPDLFETLSPPPPGVITDLRAMREILDPRICTKGNMFNEILRTGTPEEIAEGAKKVVDATWGYRHMVAISDSVLWGTPVESIRHFVKSAKDYYKEKAKSAKK